MSKIMRNGVEFTGGASAWSGTQAEYDALPIKDSTTLYFITDASIDGHNYSTDEQIVGTWVDGSTMYEKSISVTSLAMDVGWKVIGNIAGIKDFIDCKQCLKSSDNIYTYSNLTAYYNYNNGDIGLYNDLGGNMGNMTGYVTVRYTKTST